MYRSLLNIKGDEIFGRTCNYVLYVFYAHTYREPTIKLNNHYLSKERKLYETRCESKLENKNSHRLKKFSYFRNVMQTTKLDQTVVKEPTAYPTNRPVPKADNHEAV
jgi:hypothetical protein